MLPTSKWVSHNDIRKYIKTMLSYVVTILTPDKPIVAEVLFSLFVLTAYFKSSRAKPRVWPRSPPLFIGLAFSLF